MPQDSVIYAVARVRSAEKGLIGRAVMRRVVDAGSAEEALRLLMDVGYGRMPDATLADMDQLIDNELTAAYELVREVTPDKALTDVFLMPMDVHNLKLFLKRRLTGSREEEGVMRGGLYDPDDLKTMVEKRDYSALPELFRATLDKLETGFYNNVDPVELSVRLDEAYILYARAEGNGFLARYFAAMADFDNLLALLRLKKVGAEERKLAQVLMDGGDIPRESFLRALSMNDDGIKNILSGGAKDALKRGLEEAVRLSRISAVEKARDDYLMSLAREGKNDNESIAPVVGYLLAKEQEARCVRMVLTCKRNGFNENMIEERMRELYG